MKSFVLGIAVLITLISCSRGDTKQGNSLSNPKENISSSDRDIKQNPQNSLPQSALTEAERKEIFDEFSKVELKVMKVVDKKHSLDRYWLYVPYGDSRTDEAIKMLNKRLKKYQVLKAKRRELRERLLREPKKELAEKLNLPVEQLNEIIKEGRAKGWAAPKLNPPAWILGRH